MSKAFLGSASAVYLKLGCLVMSYLSERKGRTPRSWRMHLPSQLVLTHQLFPQFLIVERVRGFPSTTLAGVIGVNGFLAQHSGQLFECGRFLAAEEDRGIHVADDGIGVVLVDGFQLGLRLQYQTGGNLTASDGGDQFFQFGNLADVGALVNEAPHMDRQHTSSAFSHKRLKS